MVDPSPIVLVVDDEPGVRKACARVLEAAGFRVSMASSGTEACALVETNSYDAIVSDLSLPGVDGIALLRHVRRSDLEVPLLLMTGAPTVDTAMEAVALGAFRYLSKPVQSAELCSAVDEAVKLHRLARIKRDALALLGSSTPLVTDRAGLTVAFERAMPTLRLVFQPIVSAKRRRIVAYEALLRVDEPALPSPPALLDAARTLGRIHEVGQRVRAEAARRAHEIPHGCDIHVNLHPDDLEDTTLYELHSPLTHVAERVVLEITEQQRLPEPDRVRRNIHLLRELGYRIALDDLGAGHAGLSSMVTLHPEIVKLDLGLVRGVDGNPTQSAIVVRIVDLCRDLNLELVAEGVETRAELDALIDAGCDLLQGYYFARPSDDVVTQLPTLAAND